MRETVSQPDNPSSLPRRAFLAFTWLLAGSGLFLAIYSFMAAQVGTWLMYALTLLMAAFCGLTAISMHLVRRERLGFALKLVIGGMTAVFFISALLVQGLGITLSLNMILLVLLLLWAVPVLPSNQTYTVLLGTIIIGIILLSVDLVIANLTTVDPRMSIPLAGILIPLITAILTVGYGVIIFQQFRGYLLQTKLIISFIGVSLFSVLAVGLIINLVMTRLLTQGATQRLASAAKQTATTFDGFVSNNFSILENEAQLSNFIDMRGSDDFQPNGNAQWLALRTFKQRDPQNIISYGVLDKEGFNLADTVSVNPNTSEADQDYFRVPISSNKPYLSPVMFSKKYDQPILIFSVPVHNLLGAPVGVLRVIYRASVLQDLILQANNLSGEQSYAMLVDENFLRLADGEYPGSMYTLISPLTPSLEQKLQAAERLPAGSPSETAPRLDDFKEGLINFEIWPGFSAEVYKDEVPNSQAEQVYVVSLFAGTEWKTAAVPKWKVAFVQAPSAFLAPVRAQTQVLVLTALVIMAFVAGLAIWLGQYLAGPIIRLTAVTERVAAGDFEIQAKVESKDEIGLLATAFNQMTTQLGKLVGSLESQVAERTVDLALSMEVGQRASAIRNVDELIPTIADFIQDQFDLYYVQILWIDDTGETLTQKAAASKSGAVALSYASIPINPQSVIGLAAATGEPVVVPDAHQHHLFVHDPMLMYTRSSLTIPLLVENKVIAVLDMQSVDRYHFTSDNLTVYQAMATQVAVSIDSAEQWALAQKSQRRAEQAVQQLTRQAWAEKLSAHKGRSMGYAYNLSEIVPLQTQPEVALQAPIVVQNQPIGHLAVTPAQNRSISEDEQLLIRAIAQQLAQKAENLLLFEATQEQAGREQLARQITDKIRASRNIEAALQTAASELSRALRVPQTVIDLYISDKGDTNPVLPK